MDTNKTIYHICNLNASEPEEFASWKNIDSQNKLQALDRSLEKDEQRIFLINIHLNWGRPYCSDYGFEVARQIRVEMQSIAPIIFYSPIPFEYFECKSESNDKYFLLFGSGSEFIESPFSQEDLDTLVSELTCLTRSELCDVQTMLCDLKGIVLEKLTHGLQFGRDLIECLNEVEQLLDIDQLNAIDFDNHKSQLVSNGPMSTSAFDEIKEALLSNCRRKLIGSKGVLNKLQPDIRYRILLVEDDANQRKAIKQFMKKSFDVLDTGDCDEAVKLLEDDVQNNILAVICDWRLMRQKPRNRFWQRRQGYTVLETASKTGYRALFALTAQDDDLVNKIRNQLGFQFQLIKKQNVKTADQKGLLENLVQQECKAARETISDRGITASWSHKSLFLEKSQRLSEWDDLCARVYSQADSVLNYVEENSEAAQNIIKGHAANFKNLPSHFGLKVTETAPLEPAFVLRLIVFSVWYKFRASIQNLRMESESATLYKIITGGDRFEDPDNSRRVFMNKIGLTEKIVKRGYHLPHESVWLKKKNLI